MVGSYWPTAFHGLAAAWALVQCPKSSDARGFSSFSCCGNCGLPVCCCSTVGAGGLLALKPAMEWQLHTGAWVCNGGR